MIILRHSPIDCAAWLGVVGGTVTGGELVVGTAGATAAGNGRGDETGRPLRDGLGAVCVAVTVDEMEGGAVAGLVRSSVSGAARGASAGGIATREAAGADACAK